MHSIAVDGPRGERHCITLLLETCDPYFADWFGSGLVEVLVRLRHARACVPDKLWR